MLQFPSVSEADELSEKQIEMPKRMTIDGVIAHLERETEPFLMAIDGLPCAGKSIVAKAIQSRLGYQYICVDDFGLPAKDWPSRTRPAFPFQFFRYGEFLETVSHLATTGACTFRPFDWRAHSFEAEARTVRLSKPVIIEGVSTLNPALHDLYRFRVFVESDRSTTLETALKRGVGSDWAAEWRDLILPSADLYMRSEPEKRADAIIAGRGAPKSELSGDRSLAN